MNIAIIVPSLAGGGSERAAQVIGNHFSRQNCRVFYFLFDNDLRSVYETNGTTVQTGIKQGEISNFQELFSASKLLRKLKKEYQIEVAISFQETANLVNILSRRSEKVIISIRTVLSLREDLKGFIYNKKCISFFYPFSNAIVAVSKYVRQDLVKYYGINAKRVTVIENPALLHETNDNKRWEYGEKAVISVARLEPVKQQDRIMRAFSYVCQKDQDATLLLIGTGYLEDYLKKLSRYLKIEKNVYFLGFTDTPSYYMKRGRLLVMASRVEGFPNVMLEAMACGMPIVSTESPGGCREIIGVKQGSDDIQYCPYGIITPYLKGKVHFSAPITEDEKRLGTAILSVLEDDAIYNKYCNMSIKRSQYYSEKRLMSRWDEIVR